MELAIVLMTKHSLKRNNYSFASLYIILDSITYLKYNLKRQKFIHMNVTNTHCFIDGWLIDYQQGAINHRETKDVKRLGEYQLKLLDVLAQHAGTVLSREQLTNLVWENRVIGNNSLPNAIHALRSALDDNGKHQRIIKTIPKKGYLLEKEYCQYETYEISNDEVLHDSDIKNIEQIEDQSIEHQTGTKIVAEDFCLAAALKQEEVPTKKRNVGAILKKTKKYLFGMAAIMLMAFASGKLLFSSPAPLSPPDGMSVTRDQIQPYDHIILHNVAKKATPTRQESYSVPERLKESLNKINQSLSNTKTIIHAYYRATDSILHYTFSIQSACENKELSMNIFHWRVNGEKLNTLVYQETERKLNELVTCHS